MLATRTPSSTPDELNRYPHLMPSFRSISCILAERSASVAGGRHHISVVCSHRSGIPQTLGSCLTYSCPAVRTSRR